MFITMCLTENNVSQESILLAHPNYELRNVQSLLITLSILIVPICELLLAEHISAQENIPTLHFRNV